LFGKPNVPKPVEKGVVKVPVVMQLETLECGTTLTPAWAHWKPSPHTYVRQCCLNHSLQSFMSAPFALKERTEASFPCLIQVSSMASDLVSLSR